MNLSWRKTNDTHHLILVWHCWLILATVYNIQSLSVSEESDGQLPFLDILLSREEDGFISTSVHCKTTHTNQYLCFHSHHPTAHKRAVVRTLVSVLLLTPSCSPQTSYSEDTSICASLTPSCSPQTSCSEDTDV